MFPRIRIVRCDTCHRVLSIEIRLFPSYAEIEWEYCEKCYKNMRR